MRRSALLLVAVLCTLAGTVQASGPSGPPGPDDADLQEAADWLLDQRGADGCIADSHRSTTWSLIAVVAAGGDPASSPSMVEGLRGDCAPEADSSQNEINTYARHVLALLAAGQDPYDFEGQDWIEEIRSYYTLGAFVDPGHPSALNDDAFAILALRAAGVPPGDTQIANAAGNLADEQNDDGGWGLTASSSSETDYTAAVVQALAAADQLEPQDATAQAAASYLQDRVDPETGCFATAEGLSTSLYSTAWAVRALPLLHEDPRAEAWGSRSAWDCLADEQTTEGGFAFGKDASAWATWEAIPALAGVPHGGVDPGVGPPTASLSTSSPPTEGQTTTLQAQSVAFAGWALPGGDVLEGADATWTPQEAGPVSMSVLVVDEHGHAAIQPFETDVQAPPEPDPGDDGDDGDDEEPPAADEASPVDATLAAPSRVERNVSFTVEVDASSQAQPVTAFRIDPPASEATDWRPTASFEVTIPSLGEATIEAWARDAGGNVSEPATTEVEVVDASPRIGIEGPQVVNRSQPVAFTAQAWDPDGPRPEVRWTAPSEAGGAQATFSFEDPGDHTLAATASDEAGNSANATWTLTARNRPPTNLSVQPAELAANASELVQATAEDPDGDELAFAWRAPKEAEPTSWGRQLHLDTGEPGRRIFDVNVSDGHGGWTSARVVLDVREEPEEQQTSAVEDATIATSAPPERGPNPASSPAMATATMPETIRAEPGERRVLPIDATSPSGSIVNVTVHLGGPLPVTGTEDATALLPALPPGEYELAARAADAQGWGPWSNATLLVSSPSHGEPLAPTGQDGEATQRATPLGLLGLLAGLLAAGRRRP